MSIDVLARAWKHSQQDSSQLLALLALASMAHDDGVLWMRGVTVEYIGRKARTKPRQTQNNLRALERAGEIYAPPTTGGRGHTTRYFVTVGLSQDEISTTLRLEYELSRAEAQRIAIDIMNRQRAQQPAPFVDSIDALEGHETGERVQSTAPIIGAEKVQSTAPFPERVQSSVIKGAIQRHENGTFKASDSADRDPIHGDHDHGSSSSGARAILRKCGIYNGTIRQVLALGIDEDTLIASVEALHRAGWGAGAIANELRDNPPMKGHPYEQPQSGIREPAAQAGAARPAPRSPERARRSAGSHNPTGGAELHNPGWMDREIAKVEAILAEERARAEL
jgi:hypothetical protein